MLKDEKSKTADSRKETMCIVATLVALALIFASALALVITLHAKDVESKQGIPMQEIEKDNGGSDTVLVSSSRRQSQEIGHDGDVNEGIKEPWLDAEEVIADGVDIDYEKSSDRKRVLTYGRHGQYVGQSYYNPSLSTTHRKKVNLRLLNLLADMIRRKGDTGGNPEAAVDRVLLRLIQKLKERKKEDSTSEKREATLTDIQTKIDGTGETRGEDKSKEELLNHVAHPQIDVPHETSYEVPHEVKESVKLTDDWINLVEHQQGTNHISDELRKNQMLHMRKLNHPRRRREIVKPHYTAEDDLLLIPNKFDSAHLLRQENHESLHRIPLKKSRRIADEFEAHAAIRRELQPIGEAEYNAHHHGDASPAIGSQRSKVHPLSKTQRGNMMDHYDVIRVERQEENVNVERKSLPEFASDRGNMLRQLEGEERRLHEELSHLAQTVYKQFHKEREDKSMLYHYNDNEKLSKDDENKLFRLKLEEQRQRLLDKLAHIQSEEAHLREEVSVNLPKREENQPNNTSTSTSQSTSSTSTSQSTSSQLVTSVKSTAGINTTPSSTGSSATLMSTTASPTISHTGTTMSPTTTSTLLSSAVEKIVKIRTVHEKQYNLPTSYETADGHVMETDVNEQQVAAGHEQSKRTQLHIKPEGLDHPFLQDIHDKGHHGNHLSEDKETESDVIHHGAEMPAELFAREHHVKDHVTGAREPNKWKREDNLHNIHLKSHHDEISDVRGLSKHPQTAEHYHADSGLRNDGFVDDFNHGHEMEHRPDRVPHETLDNQNQVEVNQERRYLDLWNGKPSVSVDEHADTPDYYIPVNEDKFYDYLEDNDHNSHADKADIVERLKDREVAKKSHPSESHGHQSSNPEMIKLLSKLVKEEEQLAQGPLENPTHQMESRIHSDSAYLADGDTWKPGIHHLPQYKSTHHGAYDWQHRHEWINHHDQNNDWKKAAEPVIEDDNVFEALQDDPDNNIRYDDALNEITDRSSFVDHHDEHTPSHSENHSTETQSNNHESFGESLTRSGKYNGDSDEILAKRGHSGHHSHWEHGDDKRRQYGYNAATQHDEHQKDHENDTIQSHHNNADSIEIPQEMNPDSDHQKPLSSGREEHNQELHDNNHRNKDIKVGHHQLGNIEWDHHSAGSTKYHLESDNNEPSHNITQPDHHKLDNYDKHDIIIKDHHDPNVVNNHHDNIDNEYDKEAQHQWSDDQSEHSIGGIDHDSKQLSYDNKIKVTDRRTHDEYDDYHNHDPTDDLRENHGVGRAGQKDISGHDAKTENYKMEKEMGSGDDHHTYNNIRHFNSNSYHHRNHERADEHIMSDNMEHPVSWEHNIESHAQHVPSHYGGEHNNQFLLDSHKDQLSNNQNMDTLFPDQQHGHGNQLPERHSHTQLAEELIDSQETHMNKLLGYNRGYESNVKHHPHVDISEENLQTLIHDTIHGHDGLNGREEMHRIHDSHGKLEEQSPISSEQHEAEHVESLNRAHSNENSLMHTSDELSLEGTDEGHEHDRHDHQQGQHRPIDDGTAHKFDPVLYARLGYWPYRHIDGDARQLYYAQWLRRNLHRPSVNGERHGLTAEGIQEFLHEKLHKSKRNKTHYPPQEELDQIKLYKEFLKRSIGRDVNNHNLHPEHSSHLPKHHSDNSQHSSEAEHTHYASKLGDHQVDVLDSSHLNTTVSGGKSDVHADKIHHSLENEQTDVAPNSNNIDKSMNADEIKYLFATDEHRQYNPDILGDVNQFSEFDITKRIDNSLHPQQDKSLIQSFNTKPNMHIHTKFMNNYRPTEHIDTDTGNHGQPGHEEKGESDKKQRLFYDTLRSSVKLPTAGIVRKREPVIHSDTNIGPSQEMEHGQQQEFADAEVDRYIPTELHEETNFENKETGSDVPISEVLRSLGSYHRHIKNDNVAASNDQDLEQRDHHVTDGDHLADINPVHHIRAEARALDKSKSAKDSGEIALELLQVLQQYNAARTKMPLASTEKTTYNHTQEELDHWLDEILDISHEPDVLAAALELYSNDKEQLQTASQYKPYQWSTNLLRTRHKLHKSKHSNLPPTYHLNRKHSVMTYKRQENGTFENITDVDEMREESLADSEQLEVSNWTTISNVEKYFYKQDLEKVKLEKEMESEIETQILNYVINNMSLTVEQAKEMTTSTNRSFVDTITNTKISLNWLIISICATFSATCLCALGVGCVAMVTNRNRFSADEWWNNKGGLGEEGVWLGSRSDVDLESGNNTLKSLYSLHGDDLKKEVSRMVYDLGSASSSTTSEK